MEAHGLVVGDVAPAFALAREQFGIEAPRNDRGNDQITGTIHVEPLRDDKELTLAARETRSVPDTLVSRIDKDNSEGKSLTCSEKPAP